MTTPRVAPLGRSIDRDVLDWDGVEPRAPTRSTDVFGLKPEDRAALGLSAPRPLDVVPHLHGDAQAALADALARGAAVAKSERAARKR